MNCPHKKKIGDTEFKIVKGKTGGEWIIPTKKGNLKCPECGNYEYAPI